MLETTPIILVAVIAASFLPLTIQAPAPNIDVPIIWLLGPPGAGKTSLSKMMVKKYGFTHLSTGNLLRDEVASGSPYSEKLSEIMARGDLVPSDFVLSLLEKAILTKLPETNGYIIDGYPRRIEQAIRFDEEIRPVDLILYFTAPDHVLFDRVMERGKTSGRVDDNEETFKTRLQTFYDSNNDIIKYYGDKVKKINTHREIPEMLAQIYSFIDPLL